jgi:hypothetical protein
MCTKIKLSWLAVRVKYFLKLFIHVLAYGKAFFVCADGSDESESCRDDVS